MPEKKTENPKLLIFFGMVAAGKSYLADRWAGRGDCSYHNTDVVRKELAGLDSTSSQQAGVDQGIYRAEFTRRTYDELIRLTTTDLDRESTRCIVLDGSYRETSERERVVSAFSGKCSVYFIYCFCSEEIVRERLVLRGRDPHAVSDGRWEIYLLQKKNFQVLKMIEGAELLQLNTEKPIDNLVEAVDVFVS